MPHFETKNSPSWGHNVALELIQGTPPPGKNFFSWKMKNNLLQFTEDNYWPLNVYQTRTFDK